GRPQPIRRATRSSITSRAANASGAGWEEDGVRGHSAGDSVGTSAWARPASELVTGSFMGTMSFIGEEALLVLGVGRADAAMVRSPGRRIPWTTPLHYSETTTEDEAKITHFHTRN